MALTNVESLKDYIGIDTTVYDGILIDILDAVSAQIERYCGRTFTQADYTEFRTFESDGTVQFKVRNHPVTKVYFAATGNTEMVEVLFNAQDTTMYQTYLDTTSLIVSQADGTTTNTFALADYADIEALFDAVAAIYTGFTITYAADWYKQLPPWALIPSAYASVDNYATTGQSFWGAEESLNLVKADPSDRLFRVPRVRENMPVIIRYQAGYATIPYDLQMMCKKLAQGVWERSGSGSGVTQDENREKVGKYEVEKSTGASLTKAGGSRSIKGLVNGLMTADILFDLDLFRNKDLA